VKESYDPHGPEQRGLTIDWASSAAGRSYRPRRAPGRRLPRFTALIGRVAIIKMFGVGHGFQAIAVDATRVRAALATAFMRLAGDPNWWEPGPTAADSTDRIGIARGGSE